jgi:hypothetical protein
MIIALINMQQIVHELPQGRLSIRITQSSRSGGTNTDQIIGSHHDDWVKFSARFSFLRRSDGKLYESLLNNSQIQKLHPILNISQIIGTLDLLPSESSFLHTETKLCLCVVWTKQNQVNESKKEIQGHKIMVKIPEKICQPEPETNQQIIELIHLLAFYKQHIDNLKMQWSREASREGLMEDAQNSMIPVKDPNRILRLRLSSMDWLSFSDYGKVHGYDKYYKEFKSCKDMAT